MTARVDAVLLHPVAGLAILLCVLFVMSRRCSPGQAGDGFDRGGFDVLGALAQDTLPAGLLQSFIQTASSPASQRGGVPAADS